MQHIFRRNLMKRQTIFCFFLFVLLLLAALLLAACSPAATPSPARPAAQEKLAQPAAATAAPMPTQAAVSASGEQASGSTSPLAFSPAGSQLVIKDAQLDLLVRDTAQALDRVTALAGDEAGYIISSKTWYQDGYLYASLRLGIPSARFEAALNQLRAIGLTVLSENAQGQDVSDQYVDLQSKLTNLEATAARVRDFLKDAKTIEESLRINQQLAELEAQIEQIKGQMRYFEGRSAYSTVTVSLTPEYPTPTPTVTPTMRPTPTSTPPWSPGDTFDDASGVLSKQFQAFVDGLIWIGVVFLPWTLLLALGLLLVRGIVKKAMPKMK
jgi:hypothetical protein